MSPPAMLLARSSCVARPNMIMAQMRALRNPLQMTMLRRSLAWFVNPLRSRWTYRQLRAQRPHQSKQRKATPCPKSRKNPRACFVAACVTWGGAIRCGCWCVTCAPLLCRDSRYGMHSTLNDPNFVKNYFSCVGSCVLWITAPLASYVCGAARRDSISFVHGETMSNASCVKQSPNASTSSRKGITRETVQ